MKLRPYQTQAIASCRAQYGAGKRAVALVLPTGAGKTVIAAEVIRNAIDRGGSVLFLVHREELLVQSVRKLESVGCHDLRIIRAGNDLGNPQAKITVASIPTLTRWPIERLPTATLVVFDECHHVKAKTWGSLAAAYPAARILGLTATPQRADGKPLGDIFDALVVGATVSDLTALGNLVPATIWAPPNILESGELSVSPLEAYLQYGDGEPAVVFCVTVEHAQNVAIQMTRGGVLTEPIYGEMPADLRRARLAALANGGLRALTCVHTLTEGWDSPTVAVCILARKPAHAGLYLQICGRVLRPAPGKDRAIILDLCGASLQHGPPDMDRTYSLKGKGIDKPARDAIAQCPSCGSVFMRVPVCPECGRDLPTRPVVLPVSVDKGLQASKRSAEILQKNIQRVAYRHPAGWAEQALTAITEMR